MTIKYVKPKVAHRSDGQFGTLFGQLCDQLEVGGMCSLNHGGINNWYLATQECQIRVHFGKHFVVEPFNMKKCLPQPILLVEESCFWAVTHVTLRTKYQTYMG